MKRDELFDAMPLERRLSKLGSRLTSQKLEDAKMMSPEQRLLLALKLSDVCLELRRACLPKR